MITVAFFIRKMTYFEPNTGLISGGKMVQLVRVSASNQHDIALISELYDISFPDHEKRSIRGRESLLPLEQFYLYKIVDNNQFVGFIGGWLIETFFYIEHFAIAQHIRGAGYGQKSLSALCQLYPRIVLEIDPLVDEVARKRLHFYEKNGFIKNDYSHHHPSYNDKYTPHKLEILSLHSPFTQDEYQTFNQFLVNTVMNRNFL